MPEKLHAISSDAVKKATGKTWEQWVFLLDKLGTKNMAHREIVRMLFDRKLIRNPWWCQMVTVGYEYARGKRALGKTAPVGFEVGISKTLPITPREAWRMIISQRGRKLWLGDVPRLKFKKGERFHSRDAAGEIRTVKPGHRLRLTYQPGGAKAATTLQITVTPRQTTRGTCIRFHQEKLVSAEEREHMRRHWQSVLQAFSRAKMGK